jgi:hypothetical protein
LSNGGLQKTGANDKDQPDLVSSVTGFREGQPRFWLGHRVLAGGELPLWLAWKSDNSGHFVRNVDFQSQASGFVERP